MISVLVANPKGGCGKTTIATQLAAAFANQGFKTALAETDRQRSSLDWLEARPKDVAPIECLNWINEIKKPPKKVSRLVIDSAGSGKIARLRELVRFCDVILIPILPSAFDFRSTKTFLEKFGDVKPIKKNKKSFALVRNRVRHRSRAVKWLDSLMVESKATDIGWVSDRALYNEVAWQGLSIFDLHTRQALELQNDWIPLFRFIERHSDTKR
ncbi:MAG: ParA family protein [Kiloniellales bacterium]|nr:ParA family protein [Kiloniellales bacterium]